MVATIKTEQTLTMEEVPAFPYLPRSAHTFHFSGNWAELGALNLVTTHQVDRLVARRDDDGVNDLSG